MSCKADESEDASLLMMLHHLTRILWESGLCGLLMQCPRTCMLQVCAARSMAHAVLRV